MEQGYNFHGSIDGILQGYLQGMHTRHIGLGDFNVEGTPKPGVMMIWRYRCHYFRKQPKNIPIPSYTPLKHLFSGKFDQHLGIQLWKTSGKQHLPTSSSGHRYRLQQCLWGESLAGLLRGWRGTRHPQASACWGLVWVRSVRKNAVDELYRLYCWSTTNDHLDKGNHPIIF